MGSLYSADYFVSYSETLEFVASANSRFYALEQFDGQIRTIVKQNVIDKYVGFDDYYTAPSLITNVVQLYVSKCYTSIQIDRSVGNLIFYCVNETRDRFLNVNDENVHAEESLRAYR